MAYDPAQHHRRSIRLRGFDYSTAGAYFVTLSTHNHQCLFGSITEDKMLLTDAGRMIQDVWQGLPERLEYVQLDEYVVMPNHFHALLFMGSRANLVFALLRMRATMRMVGANLVFALLHVLAMPHTGMK